MLKIWSIRIGVFLAVLMAFGIGWFFWKIAPIGAAYTAKRVCSEVFLADRDPEQVFQIDVLADNNPLLPLTAYEVDPARQRVSATLLHTNQRVAVYREGLGCTLALDVAPDTLQSLTAPDLPPVTAKPDGFATRHPAPAGTDLDKLDQTLEAAFAVEKARTWAVAIAYDGQLIAERYADGISPTTRLLGWSMTKSAMNALTGILVQQGKIQIDDPAPIAPWRIKADDPRAGITWRHLLTMSSGLSFSEAYFYPRSDVVVMLYDTGDAAWLAATKDLQDTPGRQWAYSSGTSNILSSAIRATLGNDAQTYWALPTEALFRPLGMTTALIEPDAAGTFVGSSYMYASARDWLRFGELYRLDGAWEGHQILPKGWAAFTAEAAPGERGEIYGAQWWKTIFSGYSSDTPKPLPDDAFHAVGHEGQLLTVIPSRKLVAVRLGIARGGKWEHDRFINGLLEALPSP